MIAEAAANGGGAGRSRPCVVAAAPAATPGEAATATYFASIRNDPSLLLAFLAEMPKGGDLHNHLSGAIYAESYLRWAADDGLCVATATMSIVGGAVRRRPQGGRRPPTCCATARSSTRRSTRCRCGTGIASLNGHDHFFATFGKFGPPSARTGDMLAEVTARAAAEHVSYLELMVTPDGGAGAARGHRGRLGSGPRAAARQAARRADSATPSSARRGAGSIDGGGAAARELLQCGTPQADPGCRVTVRYISRWRARRRRKWSSRRCWRASRSRPPSRASSA